MIKPIPPFSEFYLAVHGHPPFPWQRRLAELARNSEWPSEIGVPTGLGKTACLDIAVWALAAQADRAPSERSAPTRIWWLVNRRLLVDATYNHATRLAGMLENPHSEATDVAAQQVLVDVADRLRTLSPEGRRPLEVIRLRGGAPSARPSTPAQPAIVLATLPMYGSRLLFRGFGASSSMWPIDAALAGTDSLVLIDEAHLARSLVDLFQPLSECDRSRVPVITSGRSRPVPVTLTATGTAPDYQRFDLDANDLANPVIAQRLDGPKPTRIVVSTASAKVAALAAQALALLDTPEPTSVVVFANTPRVAREVFAEIRKRADTTRTAIDLQLLTGRVREREGAAIRAKVLDPIDGVPSSRPLGPRARHLVVVATQTLEVGADVDFEQLVTEACGTRALTQRLGRLNRLGRHPESRAVYVHVEPATKTGNETTWPIYGTEPAVVLERLRAAATGDTVDLGARVIRSVLGEPLDDNDFAPQVLPALLREWAKTSLPPDGEAPVEQYFSGLQQHDLRASVCWRAYEAPDGERLWPRVRDSETVDVPIDELRESLDGLKVRRLQRDRLTIETTTADRIRPGDLIILRSHDGRYDQHGWAPNVTDTGVPDVSVLSGGLPLDEHALSSVAGPGPWRDLVEALLAPPDDAEHSDQVQAARNLIDALRQQPSVYTDAEWMTLLGSLSLDARHPFGEVPRLEIAVPPEEPRADDLDELSLATTVSLEQHGAGVGSYASRIAQRIGLSPDLAAAVGMAGELHDIGKADRRFQAWLDPAGRSDTPVAKSDRPRSRWMNDRIAAGWPAGGRHETLSARLAHQWCEHNDDPSADLIVHLIASHHGHARPLTLPVSDGTPSEVTVTVKGRQLRASADLATSDWDQPRRFHALCGTYGYWGLALLEACVRQADHAVSGGNGDWTVL